VINAICRSGTNCRVKNQRISVIFHTNHPFRR